MKKEVIFIKPPNIGVPAVFPGERVFFSVTRRGGAFDNLPWKSKKDEGDFEGNSELCIVSVTRKEYINSYDKPKQDRASEKVKKETVSKPRAQKPKKLRKIKTKFEVKPIVHSVTINTLQKDIMVNISGELSVYRPGVQDSEIKIPSGSHEMFLVNAYAGIKDLGKWIGLFKDGVFYGRTPSSWKMVKDGAYGEIILTIEGFDLDTV